MNSRFIPFNMQNPMELYEHEICCPRCGYQVQMISRSVPCSCCLPQTSVPAPCYCLPTSSIQSSLHTNPNLGYRHACLTDLQQLAQIQLARAQQQQVSSTMQSPTTTRPLPGERSAFRPYERRSSTPFCPPWIGLQWPKPVHRPIPTYRSVQDLNMTYPTPNASLAQQQANYNYSVLQTPTRDFSNLV